MNKLHCHVPLLQAVKSLDAIMNVVDAKVQEVIEPALAILNDTITTLNTAVDKLLEPIDEVYAWYE